MLIAVFLTFKIRNQESMRGIDNWWRCPCATMVTLLKAYNICVTMVAQGHRHQLSMDEDLKRESLCLY